MTRLWDLHRNAVWKKIRDFIGLFKRDPIIQIPLQDQRRNVRVDSVMWSGRGWVGILPRQASFSKVAEQYPRCGAFRKRRKKTLRKRRYCLRVLLCTL